MVVKIKLSIENPEVLSNVIDFFNVSEGVKIKDNLYEFSKDFMMVDLINIMKNNISTFKFVHHKDFMELRENGILVEPGSENLMKKRVKWEEFFMEQAVIFSKRATCNRLKVGVVITTKENIQLAEGYNGSISGHPHCEEDGCLMNDEGRCIRTIHAEQNALLNAMKKGVSVVGGIAYVTHEPCETCTKLLLQSGVVEIVYLYGYNNKYNQEFLNNSGVTFREFNGEGKERLMKLVEEIRG